MCDLPVDPTRFSILRREGEDQERGMAGRRVCGDRHYLISNFYSIHMNLLRRKGPEKEEYPCTIGIQNLYKRFPTFCSVFTQESG